MVRLRNRASHKAFLKKIEEEKKGGGHFVMGAYRMMHHPWLLTKLHFFYFDFGEIAPRTLALLAKHRQRSPTLEKHHLETHDALLLEQQTEEENAREK